MIQIADLIAFTGGFRLYIPDFFRGNAWPLDQPIYNLKGFFDVNNWHAVRPTFIDAISYLKRHGVERVASLGFCWGGKMAVSALAEKLVIATACPHPSMLEAGAECAAGLPGPICFLLSKDEGSFDLWYRALEAAPENIRQLSHIYRFRTMHHGFMSGRGDFSDPENRRMAEEGATMIIDFLVNVFAAKL